jgi:hypothetical protein
MGRRENKMNNPRGYLRLGIDPGTDKSGIALMEDGKYVKLSLWSFMELHDYIVNRDKCLVVTIEDVMAIKPTFDRYANKDKNKKIAEMKKIAQNVGMVKGTYCQIIKMLEYYDCQYEATRPLQGTLKAAKHSAATFQRFTGWAESSNEHNRDAAMLLYHYKSAKNNV